MCGIVGLYYADKRSVDPDVLRRMNAMLVHRARTLMDFMSNLGSAWAIAA